jgi:hypothetical protein
VEEKKNILNLVEEKKNILNLVEEKKKYSEFGAGKKNILIQSFCHIT